MKTAIILAAGAGKKMWPYSVTRNKALLPVANRPLLSWQIDALHQAGIENILIAVDYRKEQIISLIANQERIKTIPCSACAGTATALVTAWASLEDADVLVCYGDVLFSKNEIETLIKTHKEKKAIASALVQSLQEEKPNEWLCAQVDGEKISYVLGHPRDSVTHRLCGVYALNVKFLPYLKQSSGRFAAIQVGMMPPDENMIEDALQTAIEKNVEIAAVPAQLFYDLDKPWHLLAANYGWVKYISQNLQQNSIAKNARISERAVIKGHVVIGENSEIGDAVIMEGNVWIGDNTSVVQGAIVEKDVVIGDHCTVRRYSQIEEGTSVGDRCFIGHCAEVAGVMMRLSYAYHYGEYWGIMGESCDLGAATVCGNLRFDDRQTLHDTYGHRETPILGANAAYLGDYVRTGVNAILMPGVKVGPYSVIGAGTMVTEDVPDKSLVYVKQELVRKSWGPERYGW